jgi:hypothetical protein
MDAAMIAILGGMAVCMLLAEFSGTLWDALWRYFE